MASLLTHAVVGAALGQAGKKQWRHKPGFWVAAIFFSALPDIDVIGFSMGVRYGDLWGHRGMTHSLLFAAAVSAVIAAMWSGMSGERWKVGLLFFSIIASHGLLDAMTDGGLGVAFFSPFDTHRYFFPWRPIHVSPIGVHRFFSARGIEVLRSEIIWIWLPSAIFALTLWGVRAWKARLRHPEHEPA
jgi:inner membrane protein